MLYSTRVRRNARSHEILQPASHKDVKALFKNTVGQVLHRPEIIFTFIHPNDPP